MQLDDLKARLQELADEVAILQGQVGTLQAAVTQEITRVEAVIAALKAKTGIDPTELDPLIAQLQTSVDNLKQTGSALDAARSSLDAEQPAPPQPGA